MASFKSLLSVHHLNIALFCPLAHARLSSYIGKQSPKARFWLRWGGSYKGSNQALLHSKQNKLKSSLLPQVHQSHLGISSYSRHCTPSYYRPTYVKSLSASRTENCHHVSVVCSPLQMQTRHLRPWEVLLFRCLATNTLQEQDDLANHSNGSWLRGMCWSRKQTNRNGCESERWELMYGISYPNENQGRPFWVGQWRIWMLGFTGCLGWEGRLWFAAEVV